MDVRKLISSNLWCDPLTYSNKIFNVSLLIVIIRFNQPHIDISAQIVKFQLSIPYEGCGLIMGVVKGVTSILKFKHDKCKISAVKTATGLI